MDSTPPRLVEVRREGAVAIVRRVNDRSRDSLSNEMRAELAAAFAGAAADEAVRAIHLTGSGSAFCAGGDLKNLQAVTGPWSAHRRFAVERRIKEGLELDAGTSAGQRCRQAQSVA